MTTRKDCFELFGEMRHSTEEEKKLYEDMLNRLSEHNSLFDRVILGELPTCKDCKHFIGGGDWKLCCTVKQGYWLCYEDTWACEEFVEKGNNNEALF